MSAETIDRGAAPVAAAVLPAPPALSPVLPPAIAGAGTALRNACAARVAGLGRRLERHRRTAVRFARRQTEFNQIARFVLAIPLLAGTPSYVAYDARPPIPPDFAAAMPAPAPAPAMAVPAPVPTEPGTLYRTTEAEPARPAAEAEAGPRIRAICSRGGQTVFLDDRAESNASADWREEVSLKHPGAVCAFAPRFGLPDPQFRRIETNTVPAAPAPSLPATTSSSAKADANAPLVVRTVPVTASLSPLGFAAPDLRTDAFTPAPERSEGDKEQIEQALAALSAPSSAVGGKLAPVKAMAAAKPVKMPPFAQLQASVPMPAPAPRRLETRTASADPVADLAPVVPKPEAVHAIAASITPAWGSDAVGLRFVEQTRAVVRKTSETRSGADGFAEDLFSDTWQWKAFSVPTWMRSPAASAWAGAFDANGLGRFADDQAADPERHLPPQLRLLPDRRRSEATGRNKAEFDAAFAAFPAGTLTVDDHEPSDGVPALRLAGL